MEEKERIQKVMAMYGIGSRRYCDSLIEAGRVTVNGHPAQTGAKINPDNAIIAIDGVNIKAEKESKKRYVILNKPRGYVTTMKDEMGRKCVAQLTAQFPERLYPVGRLDRNSEGLLIMTNDGELANRLMHPSGHVSKKYRVTVTPDISDEQLSKMAGGVEIEDEKTAPCIIRVLQKEPGRVVLEMTLFEGKNRQIRKMCETVGLTVARLKRTSVGPIKLGMLGVGQARELTAAEVKSLKNAAAKKEALPDD